MRFLADAGISPKTVDFLNQLGHEAVHVRTLGMERAGDSDLVARAREDSSVVVTFDLDFGDILALGVLDKPSAIICRLVDERAAAVNLRLATVLAERIAELESGVDPRRRHAVSRPEAPDWSHVVSEEFLCKDLQAARRPTASNRSRRRVYPCVERLWSAFGPASRVSSPSGTMTVTEARFCSRLHELRTDRAMFMCPLLCPFAVRDIAEPGAFTRDFETSLQPR
jgi:predicted nuclease of predicted toxin-antitoxin system